jgi:murein DD-endopeptidase MepM/ murein hydrolase activator NlpD
MRIARLLACLFNVFLMTGLVAQSQDVLTPVIASPLVPSTYAVQGTDNRQHLVYELVITNTGTVTATLEKIEVVSGDASQRVLATFEGDGLLTRLRSTGRGPEITVPRIEFSGTRLFLVDFTVDKDSVVPATLMHRLHLLAGGPPGSPKDQTVEQTYTVAPIAVSTDVTVLGPPLSGKGWAAFNGCCGPGGAHRGTGLPVNGRVHYAQRFAIDWMLLNHDAKFFHGDGKNVKDYADYGASVIAVADGTVVETLSTLDEQVPGQLPDPKTINIENVDGNHIVLDLGHGKYAFYAHLQKNSLLVSKGDHVKRGQALALLGNTGNTSAPHLHFHLMDGTSVLGSSGLPYVIDRFEVAGELSSKQFNASELDGEWSKDLSAHPTSRKLEFPLDLTVVDF